jgi:hypothetical protein
MSSFTTSAAPSTPSISKSRSPAAPSRLVKSTPPLPYPTLACQLNQSYYKLLTKSFYCSAPGLAALLFLIRPVILTLTALLSIRHRYLFGLRLSVAARTNKSQFDRVVSKTILQDVLFILELFISCAHLPPGVYYNFNTSCRKDCIFRFYFVLYYLFAFVFDTTMRFEYGEWAYLFLFISFILF